MEDALNIVASIILQYRVFMKFHNNKLYAYQLLSTQAYSILENFLKMSQKTAG